MAAVVLVAGCLAVPGAAWADLGLSEVIDAKPDPVVIENDGKHYTGPAGPQATLVADYSYRFDAGNSGKVQRYAVWLKVRAENTEWRQFKQHKSEKIYPIGSRPKVAQGTGVLALPYADYANLFTFYCNKQAQSLRSQGLKNHQIFSQNRPLQVAVQTAHEYEMSGWLHMDTSGSGGLWEDQYKIDVICKGEPGQLDPATPPILGALLQAKAISKVTANGSCDLQLNGSIVSRDPNTPIAFMYVDDKGKQSALRSVVTDANGHAAFQHEFPVGNGKQSGKIRVVGQSEPFFSNWASYQTDCHKMSEEQGATLPPLPIAVEAHALPEEISREGMICPAKVKVYGVLKGRGPMDGFVTIHANGKLAAQELFVGGDGNNIVVQGEYALDWETARMGFVRVGLRMDVINGAGTVVLDQMKKSWRFRCRKPQVSEVGGGAAGGVVSNAEVPNATALSVSGIGKKRLKGHVCDATARISAFVQSNDEGFTGKLVIYADGSVKREIDLDLPPNHGVGHPYDYELPWSAANYGGQSVHFAMKVLNRHGHEVASKEEVESFDCTKIVTGGVALPDGGFAPAPKDPTTSQQNRPAAAGQLAIGPALAIMAPKGTVRSGQIRLTGGPANATYELTFYRKVNSSYQPVNLAGLPKHMTGLTASFDLSRLDGAGQWRLEVCPVRGGQGSCKTSDFRLSVIGKKKQQAPAQGTPLIIVPGTMQ